eukprot:scaffold16219_cov102-Isochrysis_galbana.AAC.11
MRRGASGWRAATVGASLALHEARVDDGDEGCRLLQHLEVESVECTARDAKVSAHLAVLAQLGNSRALRTLDDGTAVVHLGHQLVLGVRHVARAVGRCGWSHLPQVFEGRRADGAVALDVGQHHARRRRHRPVGRQHRAHAAQGVEHAEGHRAGARRDETAQRRLGVHAHARASRALTRRPRVQHSPRK